MYAVGYRQMLRVIVAGDSLECTERRYIYTTISITKIVKELSAAVYS